MPQEEAIPWWTRPFRTLRRDYIREYDRLLAQDPAELAREARQDFHANVEWVMANLGCAPGLAHIVTFDSPYFEKLDLLGQRDVLRDYLPHATRQGIRVLAYLNLHWFSFDFADAHPGWEQMLADGTAYGRRYPLYGSGTTMCVNSGWREWAFQLLREAMRTGIAGAFLDGPVIYPGACYCPICRELFRRETGAPAPEQEDWRSETWKQWIEFREESLARFLTDARAALRSVNPAGAIYLNGGTYAGGAWRVARDAQRLWNCQDINGAEEFYHPTHGRQYILASALLGKFLGARNRVAQVYTHHALGAWHYIPLPVNEMKRALAQTVASGANTWFAVWDRALEHSRAEAIAGTEVHGFVEENEEYFTDTRCAARIAMVISAASNHWYLSRWRETYLVPGSGMERDLIADVADSVAEGQRRKELCDHLLTTSIQGLFLALARTHLPVEVLWDMDVTPEVLADYDAVALANVPCLSSAQRTALRDFVSAGGGLYADFESGLYDQRSEPVEDPAWLELLGLQSVAGLFVPSLTEDYLKVRDSSPPLEGFTVGQLLPRPVHILQVRPRPEARVPILVTVPLGQSYAVPQGDTSWPGLVLSRYGAGRVAYSPGALSSAFGAFGMLQHQALIGVLVEWVLAGRNPLRVQAPQSVYVEWRRRGETVDLIHLVNNSTDSHSPIGEFIPVYGLEIRLRREGARRVRSLRMKQDLPFRVEEGWTTVILPRLDQYDVVVFE